MIHGAAVIILSVALTSSHVATYFMGRQSTQKAQLDQALAYADEIVSRQDTVDRLSADLEQARTKQTVKDRIIVKEVVRYEALPADRRCTLDGSWRVLHDAAATGSDPKSASLVAGASEPVTDATALATVTGNYFVCREYIAKLEGWQHWWTTVNSQNKESKQP